MVKMVNFKCFITVKKTNYGSQYDGEDKNNTLHLTKNFLRSLESGASSLADASSKR